MIDQKYYIIIDSLKNKIVSISNIEDLHRVNIPIETELAFKFLSGEESLSNWFLLKGVDNSYTISKFKLRNSRLESLALIEIIDSIENPNIELILKSDKLLINVIDVETCDFPISLYLTKKEDPSYLYKIIKIKTSTDMLKFNSSVNINSNNLSIYTFKRPIKISLTT